MGRKLYTEEENLVQIHTTITEEEKKEIKECNWEYNELIRLGMVAKRENPQLIRRIGFLEQEVETWKEILRKQEIRVMATMKNIEKRIDNMLKIDEE